MIQRGGYRERFDTEVDIGRDRIQRGGYRERYDTQRGI